MIVQAVRRLVWARAGRRCEYCRLEQERVALASFHVEHIVPRKHGGSDDDDNLALACHHCNFHKGPNLSGLDLDTGALAVLFNPRRDAWEAHFAARSAVIVGRTPVGRATAVVLAMNAPARIELRTELYGV